MNHSGLVLTCSDALQSNKKVLHLLCVVIAKSQRMFPYLDPRKEVHFFTCLFKKDQKMGFMCVQMAVTLRTVIVGGGNFRNLDFFPGISIYYDPPNLRFWKNIFPSFRKLSQFFQIHAVFGQISTIFSHFSTSPHLLEPPNFRF